MPALHEYRIALGDNCFLDLQRDTLLIDNFPMILPRTQVRLLHCLSLNLGKLVRTEELIAFVWGEDAYLSKDAIYVYINRIRKALEKNPKAPETLISIRSLGYILHPLNR